MYTLGVVISCTLRPAMSCIIVARVVNPASTMPVAPAVAVMHFFSLSMATAICSPLFEAMSVALISSPAAMAMKAPSYIMLLPV